MACTTWEAPEPPPQMTHSRVELSEHQSLAEVSPAVWVGPYTAETPVVAAIPYSLSAWE